MKINCIAMMHCQGGFVGLRSVGRGLILPSGRYEPAKDLTYKDTAIRHAQDEVGVTPHNLRYVWHGPDGGDYTTFAFETNSWEGIPKCSNEGVPQVVDWDDLLDSDLGAYYSILYEIMGTANDY